MRPFQRGVLSCSGVATPEDWRHGAPTWCDGRRRDIPRRQLHGTSVSRVGKLVATEPRQALNDKWAVAVVDSPPASGGRDVGDVARPVRRLRRDVCRGQKTTTPPMHPSRGRDGRRDGTPVARTMSQVGSRADSTPGAYQTASAFRCPTSDASTSVTTCRGVFGIG